MGSGTSLTISMSQKSTRRLCRMQRPMSCSTGEQIQQDHSVRQYSHVSIRSTLINGVFVLPVLRKSSEESVRERQKVVALANMKEPSLLQFYISREWLNMFNTFTEPGPISNHTFLCQHGGEQHNSFCDAQTVNVLDYLYNPLDC